MVFILHTYNEGIRSFEKAQEHISITSYALLFLSTANVYYSSSQSPWNDALTIYAFVNCTTTFTSNLYKK